MLVAVIGQGYVGTAIGQAAHRAGHDVLGIEIDEDKLKSLMQCDYRVTNDYSQIAEAEIIILAVPTPLTENRHPDLSFLQYACKSLKGNIKKHALIINESTSYPGTLRNLIALELGGDFLYASAPERVDPANDKWDISNTPRLISGLTFEAKMKAFAFYKTISRKIIEVSSPEVAEAAKLFENTFRQVNIALVNEFAQICHALNIPTFETLEAANSKPFGIMKFLPSLGVGGHCIPIDPHYLSYKAKEVEVDTKFINLANQINSDMLNYVVERIEREYGIENKRIQIAGIAYKPNVSDTRESPAIALIQILRKKGATVTWHDSIVSRYNNEESSPIQESDIAIICTGHNGVDYSPWRKSNTIVLDVSTSINLSWPKFL